MVTWGLMESCTAKVATLTQKGKVLLLESQYVVPIFLDQENLLSGMLPLERGLLDVQSTFSKFNLSMNLHHHRVGELLPNNHISKVLSRTILNHMEFLLKGVQSQRKEVRNFLLALGEDLH